MISFKINKSSQYYLSKEIILKIFIINFYPLKLDEKFNNLQSFSQLIPITF